MKLTQRQQEILRAIVREYEKKCEAVSSQQLVKTYFPHISSATMRNEMALLEKMGYLHSLHTSAGRLPTEQAYHFYVAKYNLLVKLPEKQKKRISELITSIQSTQEVKQLAKFMAKEMDACVIVIWNKYDHYYTGVSTLLAKKDFENPQLLYNISSIIDQLDDILALMLSEIVSDITVLVGQYNPLSRLCTAMTVQVKNRVFEASFIILTPMRTRYEQNYTLLAHIKNELMQL